jgi:cytochrome c biogenesis protein CcmG/thiol:disulfide interchange protein DsbE
MPFSSHTTPEDPTPSTPVPNRHWGSTVLWLAPVLFLAAVVIYGLLTKSSTNTPDSGPQMGQPLADFALSTLQGQSVQLSALRGTVVFINVWATWCQPCVDEMPTIQRLYESLQARGLRVVTISVDTLGAQVVAPFMQKYHLTFPVLLDPQGAIERLYRTRGVPESFIVDKHGRLVEKVIGPRDWAHPQMLAMFERLLAAPAP